MKQKIRTIVDNVPEVGDQLLYAGQVVTQIQEIHKGTTIRLLVNNCPVSLALSSLYWNNKLNRWEERGL